MGNTPPSSLDVSKREYRAKQPPMNMPSWAELHPATKRTKLRGGELSWKIERVHGCEDIEARTSVRFTLNAWPPTSSADSAVCDAFEGRRDAHSE